MILPFNKKQAQGNASSSATAPQPKGYEDFIPYYCHYNPYTLLTKNGEVLQIIKIATNNLGLEYESSDTDNQGLRNLVRDAIVSSITTDNYSFWMHTLRKHKRVSFPTQFKEPFAGYVNKQWEKKNRWKHQYYNEIYITILHDGQSTQLLEPKTLKHVVLPNRNRNYRNAFLDQSAAELDGVVSSILSIIGQRYDVKRLSAVERLPTHHDPMATQTVFYSEQMEFLSSILNMQPEECPMPDVDMSVALNTHQLTFGFNALESKSPAGKRRFAGLLTLKQYREVPLEMIDHVLQAPMDLIICQSFHFISENDALWQYKNQREIFKISGDDYSIRATGIEDMLQSMGKKLGYGAQQTSIMVLADEYKQLASEVIDVQSAFAKLGLITIREDIKLEECFWSQLPGNFEFLRRKDPISTDKVGAFCRLNRFPSGVVAQNHWGSPVALMPTTVNSPYFFNFHFQDNGHTAIFDFNSFNDPTKHILLNFLISESRKYDGKLFIFDRHQSCELFFDKLGGDYHRLLPIKDAPKRPQMMVNPFWLEENPRNQAFLLAWCVSLISGHVTVTDEQRDSIRQSLAQLYTLPNEERSLVKLIGIMQAADPELAAHFSPWHGRGKYAALLEAGIETLDLRKPMHAFDMEPIIANPDIIIPVFSYLLHRIITTIDGRPTIIVLNEAWDLLENAFFAPRLESLLEMLQQNNVMVVFTTRAPSQRAESNVLSTVMRMCATRIYLPDDIAYEYESPELGLSRRDSRMLLKMDRQKGEFLLKQNRESIGLKVSLEGMDDIYAIFSNNIKNLIAAGGEYAALPDNYG